MPDKNNKLTIKEIAQLTGLSKGTVDRVLHKRGEVSQESYDKIMRVIDRFGYQPNLYAAMLSAKKASLIAVMIPRAEKGEYWELASKGIEKIRPKADTLNINIASVMFDRNNIESFRAACRQVEDLGPTAVVLAPVFKNEAAVFTAKLRQSGIMYVYIDTKLEEDGYLAFFGMPMYQSGYLCADLLLEGGADSVAVINVEDDKRGGNDTIASRKNGFIDYINEHCPEVRLVPLSIKTSEPESIVPGVIEFFKDNAEINHLVMFNSRIHLIADALKQIEEKTGHRIKAVGFDNLEKNLDALRNGSVRYIITQHTDEQTSLALAVLSEYIGLRRMPQKRDFYLHMDILTGSNIDHY